jgi:hypothetical protein
MTRRLVMGLAALVIVAASFSPATSGASFTNASTSTITAGTAGAQTLLHLYSQSSDPDGQTGYYVQPGTSTLAATGTDATLAVNLGKQGNVATTCNRVFSIKAASSFPAGITSITVTASLVADSTTGLQPITAIGFYTWGGTGRTNPVTLTAGLKRQCNLVVNAAKPSNTVYRPTVLITVTYTGFTGTYFRYSVPFTVTAS